MTERIRELAEQAGYFIAFDPDGTLVHTSTGGADGDLALFAELIVKECAEIFEGVYTDQQRSERIDTRIKQHFGINDD